MIDIGSRKRYYWVKKIGSMKHAKTLLGWCISIMLLLFQCNTAENVAEEQTVSTTDSAYKIIGYVAGWRSDFQLQTIAADKLTHINYAFANVVDGKVAEGSVQRDTDNFTTLRALKKKNPNLKILISVGGWSWSENFSDAALTDSSRTVFANSAVEFMKKHQLDGVDIDWEYPGLPGEDNIYRPEDKENFTLMLKALREKLDVQSAADGREGNDKYLLTIATGAQEEFLNTTNLGDAHQYLDFINIMTYDFYTGGAPVTGYHTNLALSVHDDARRRSAMQSVQGHIDAGVPPRKIVLGVAFYGRGWTDVNDENNGRFQPVNGEGISFPYSTLAEKYIDKNGFVRYWDESAKTPYLWNAETKTFISYDDVESLTHKASFVKTQGLGGVMFWEYSQDMEGVLLNTLFTRFTQPLPSDEM